MPVTYRARRFEFVSRGAAILVLPERHAPHYLILGQAEWFKGLSPDTHELRVSLPNSPPM
jgi:hypothetical protein